MKTWAMPVPGEDCTIYLGVPLVWAARLQIAYPSPLTRCIIISTAHTGVGLFAAIPHAGKPVAKQISIINWVINMKLSISVLLQGVARGVAPRFLSAR